MSGFLQSYDQCQASLLPPCVDDYVEAKALVCVVDAFVQSLALIALGFERAASAATGRPDYHPGDFLRLYIWAYLKLRSALQLERVYQCDLEALLMLCRMTLDYRTIAAFRHDNPEAIVSVSAAFIRFYRESSFVVGNTVALEGRKMCAVASP